MIRILSLGQRKAFINEATHMECIIFTVIRFWLLASFLELFTFKTVILTILSQLFLFGLSFLLSLRTRRTRSSFPPLYPQQLEEVQESSNPNKQQLWRVEDEPRVYRSGFHPQNHIKLCVMVHTHPSHGSWRR